jgi:steroid delta-isomerase-like uncharacterized protein
MIGILLIAPVLMGSATWAVAQTVEKIMNDAVAAWSSHDTEKLVSLVTDDCVYEDVAFGVICHGKEELRAFVNATFAAWPDFKVEPKSFFFSGDWVGSEWVMSGTHKGDLPGIPATGRSFSVRGACITELKGGKIKRNTDYYDMASFLKQIGAMPASPPK